MADIDFIDLKQSILACDYCSDVLPLAAKPILQIHPTAKILIAGQAPGRKAHESGKPFDDPSGDRLRAWLGVSKEVFYDETKIALLPMGFCFPGSGIAGDLAPRKECAALWREAVLDQLKEVKLVIVLGTYAQAYHLQETAKKTVTEQVKAAPFWLSQGKIALPHPSPRNNRWLHQNPWFEKDTLPLLKAEVVRLLRVQSHEA